MLNIVTLTLTLNYVPTVNWYIAEQFQALAQFE